MISFPPASCPSSSQLETRDFNAPLFCSPSNWFFPPKIKLKTLESWSVKSQLVHLLRCSKHPGVSLPETRRYSSSAPLPHFKKKINKKKICWKSYKKSTTKQLNMAAATTSCNPRAEPFHIVTGGWSSGLEHLESYVWVKKISAVFESTLTELLYQNSVFK